MAIVWKAVLLLLLLLFIFYFIFIIFGNLSSSIVIKPVLWIIPSDVVVARDFVVTCVIPGKYFSSFLQNFSVKKTAFFKTFLQKKPCFLQKISAKKTCFLQNFSAKKPASADCSPVRLLPTQLGRVGHHLCVLNGDGVGY